MTAATLRVAALFVETDGIYFGLPDVEPWDEPRDARLYAGPWPVVAHPPCKRWSILGLCRGYYDGDDGGCFIAALEAVRRWGGVLEHPAHTLAWKRFGLAKPAGAGWTRAMFGDEGWTCEVDQHWYGHGARKPTWLYAVGVPLYDFAWGLSPLKTRNLANYSGGGDRTTSRERTPSAFRDVLLAMARVARPLEATWDFNDPQQRVKAMTALEGAKGWDSGQARHDVLGGDHGRDVVPDASPKGVRAETCRLNDGDRGEPSNAPTAALARQVYTNDYEEGYADDHV